mmetsp:Transcript_23610/g.27304  ORF Transcript_23610/g.27304 Transcript_23610/m.27304 type:complete len:374 (-) Transcript_23610:123-1244(-)
MTPIKRSTINDMNERRSDTSTETHSVSPAGQAQAQAHHVVQHAVTQSSSTAPQIPVSFPRHQPLSGITTNSNYQHYYHYHQQQQHRPQQQPNYREGSHSLHTPPSAMSRPMSIPFSASPRIVPMPFLPGLNMNMNIPNPNNLTLSPSSPSPASANININDTSGMNMSTRRWSMASDDDGTMIMIPSSSLNNAKLAVDNAIANEKTRIQELEKKENENKELTLDDMKLVLKKERSRSVKLAGELAAMKSMAVASQAEAEVCEEGRINGLMRRLDCVQKEKGRIIVELEREEEMLTNTLQKKLNEVRREKAELEKQIEKEHYYNLELNAKLNEKYNPNENFNQNHNRSIPATATSCSVDSDSAPSLKSDVHIQEE